jgi:lipopolysaccharide export LptBFGC system permease protein LptF
MKAHSWGLPGRQGSGLAVAALLLLMAIPLALSAARHSGVGIGILVGVGFEALFGGGAILATSGRSRSDQ